MSKLSELLQFLVTHNGINDKAKLTKLVVEKFALTKDRSVFYCDDFAIRFSSGTGSSFSNTILSLSNLKKVDHLPFLVCLVTPTKNYVFLANTTVLRKISHSSQELRVDNIKGSFNGSDIIRDLEGIVILDAPSRAAKFVVSADAVTLKKELDERVERFKNEILVAAMIENVNVRGRIIEYLIAGDDDALRERLITALQNRTSAKGLPAFRTDNTLGDYQRIFDEYFTETDVKTKIMILSSNPKAYNLDKILEFLATEKSVFMFYFVGVDPAHLVNTVLVSMFQTDLLRSTILLKHWSGRNSRGVSQFEGQTIEALIKEPKYEVNKAGAIEFLKRLIAL